MSDGGSSKPISLFLVLGLLRKVQQAVRPSSTFEIKQYVYSLLPASPFFFSMNRRTFISFSSALGAGIILPATLAAQRKPSLIFDAMGEIRTIYSMELIDEILASGLNAIAVTLTDPKPMGTESLNILLNDLADYDKYFDANPSYFIKARTVNDIDRARKERKLAVFYLIQNSAPIDKNLDLIDALYFKGLRSVQLTYNDRNFSGDGCYERTDGGISNFGIELIKKLNASRVLLDLSHAGMKTMKEAIETSSQSVIISHTCCKALRPHARNTTDENLKLLASKGGVAGITQLRTFLTDAKKDNLAVYFDHIDHAVKVAGVEHVAIGSDRDHRVIPDTEEEIQILLKEEGVQFKPQDWPLYLEKLNGPRRMEVVWDGLVKRGYTEVQIDKIMGANLYRLYREVIG